MPLKLSAVQKPFSIDAMQENEGDAPFGEAEKDASLQACIKPGRFFEHFRVVVDSNHVQCDALIDNADPAQSGVLICDRKRIKTIYGEVRIAQRALVNPQTRELQWIPRSKKAIKVFHLDKIEQLQIQEDHQQELEIQYMFSRDSAHPNVMPILDILGDNKSYYIVMPFAEGGELFDWVANGTGFVDERIVKKMFRGMVEGVQHLHEHGVAHRDVSLENFVLSDKEDPMPILIDFGLAAQLQSDPSTGKWKEIEFVQAFGKPNYISPEFFLIAQLFRKTKKRYTYDGVAQDLWALGVCLWMMLFRQRPWKLPYHKGDPNYLQIVHSKDLKGWLRDHGLVLVQSERSHQMVYRKGSLEVSESLVDLLQRMFQQEPHERFSTYDILNHPWMQ